MSRPVAGLPIPPDYDQRHTSSHECCPPHYCDSQCDDCHTHENCVPGERRFFDLLLCTVCYAKRKNRS